MRLNFILFATLILFVSCSKEKQLDKKMDGNWAVNLIRIIEDEGFMYFDSLPNGSFTFNSDLKTISANVTYRYVNLNGFTIKDTFKLDQEKYIFNSKFDRIFFRQNLDSINARVILLTKESMELEYYDLSKYKLVRCILSKD
jgi:hypothetical protein